MLSFFLSKKHILISTFLLGMSIRAGAHSSIIDSLDSQPKISFDSTALDAQRTAGATFLSQLGLTSLGFFTGFVFGGIGYCIDESNEIEPTGKIWPFITPLTTSLGAHVAATDFFKKKGGSYIGGVAAGFLGELVGVGFDIAVSSNKSLNSSPYLHALAYFIPTVSLTMILYNSSIDRNEVSNISLSPWYNDGCLGASFTLKY